MFDIVLKNGIIVDGTGNPAYKADLAMENGKIAAISQSIDEGLAEEVFDVSGLCVAPGFIDIHSHSDTAFIDDERCEAKLYQGVTSELCGNCGLSVFPSLPEKYDVVKAHFGDTGKGNYATHTLTEFLDTVSKYGFRMSTNILPLVGHGTLRAGVVGFEDRTLSKSEMASMRKLLNHEMKSGAWGLSLGLGYTPGVSSDTHELCELGCEVEPFGGIVTSHMRNQGTGTPESLNEMFEIGRYSGVHVHVAHFKAAGPDCKGKAPEWVSLLREGQQSGVNVTADVYPYTAANSGITNSFPKWSIKGGKEHAIEAVYGAERSRLLKDLEEEFPDSESAQKLIIEHTDGVYPELEGLSLEEISRKWKISRGEALAKLTYDTRAKTDCITFCMDDDDVFYMLSQNDFSIGSDGICFPFDSKLNRGVPHPRNFGTFPRFLKLAREKNICSLETAVRRITGQSADYLGMDGRGYLKEGYVADITVFDPENVADRAEYGKPFQKPVGIVDVFMDGKPAIIDGVQTDGRLGSFILKK